MNKDWRLQHLETQPYLRGVRFTYKRYRAPSPRWDHDHCVACWAKFAEPPAEGEDILHEGYATTNAYARGADYDWVCVTCFGLFAAEMGWIDISEQITNQDITRAPSA